MRKNPLVGLQSKVGVSNLTAKKLKKVQENHANNSASLRGWPFQDHPESRHGCLYGATPDTL